MVKGQKEGESETTDSNKTEDESETTDSIEELDLGEPNHMKAWWMRELPKPTPKRSRQVEGRQCYDNKGVEKGLTRGTGARCEDAKRS